jgi:type IV pilus assembly protein PilW
MNQSKSKGFSLIEILVAMSAASILIGAIYGTYNAHQKSHVKQQLAVEMQQNIRAAMSFIKREIRMGGYDPAAFDGIDNDGLNGADDAGESSGANILAANSSFINFTLDRNGDSDTSDSDENIFYSFSAADDTNGDGIADTGSAAFGRNAGAGLFTLMENVHAIGFAYAFDDDLDGQMDTSVGNNVIWAIDADSDGDLDTHLDTNDDGIIDNNDTAGGTALATEVNTDRIRAVRIWILMRTIAPIRGYNENRTYVVGDRKISVNDSYQRRFLVDTVVCRNMGIGI